MCKRVGLRGSRSGANVSVGRNDGNRVHQKCVVAASLSVGLQDVCAAGI
jgi:hypothetical protein